MLEKLKIALSQRYSVKVFDQAKAVDENKLKMILETLALAPTSINSQAWHLFVISDKTLKEKLAATAWESNQDKYRDSSHLLVFCAKTDFVEQDLQNIEELVSEVRGSEVNQERVAMLSQYVNGMPKSELQEWLKRQVYLVFGQFLTSCSLLDIDSCPVEGFSPAAMDEILELKEKGLTSVVTAVIGQSHQDDFNRLDLADKVRYPQSKMITEIK